MSNVGNKVTQTDTCVQILQISNVLYLSSVTLAKISILLFYNRLFGVNKTFRWITHSVIGFITSYFIGCALAVIFQCIPPAATWNMPLRETSQCASILTINIAIGGLNIFSDVLILLLPVPTLCMLHLSLSQKFGLVVVMTVGILYVTNPSWSSSASYQRMLMRNAQRVRDRHRPRSDYGDKVQRYG